MNEIEYHQKEIKEKAATVGWSSDDTMHEEEFFFFFPLLPSGMERDYQKNTYFQTSMLSLHEAVMQDIIGCHATQTAG